jgi:hypothetical protein
MARKKWQKIETETPATQNSREKKKWQIALRRYVINQQGSSAYAPYFGLDIKRLITWFEIQFGEGQNWETFGKTWQFGHLLPVSCFNLLDEEDKTLCWNFLNLRITRIAGEPDQGGIIDLTSILDSFRRLQQSTNNPLCQRYISKIEELQTETSSFSDAQAKFLRQQSDFLHRVAHFTPYEYGQLNKNVALEVIEQEIALMNKWNSPNSI